MHDLTPRFMGLIVLAMGVQFMLVGVSGFPMSAVATDDSQTEPDWPGSFGLFGSETLPGKGWFPVFRIYGPLKAYNDKTWKPDDVVLLK